MEAISGAEKSFKNQGPGCQLRNRRDEGTDFSLGQRHALRIQILF